ncbi:MAG: hypothetical protein KKD17_03035 [Nanoarchaeota archaeon]|nr:hypothetical protein [Nanoarchaeota archaeon]
MDNMEARDIDNLTYAEFDGMFSAGAPERGKTDKPRPESGFAATADMLLADKDEHPLFYFGPIGDVDTAFNYIANLRPEKAFLFGTRREVGYLGYRLCLFRDADNMMEYYLDMLSAKGDMRKYLWEPSDPEEINRRVLQYEVPPGSSIAQGVDFLKTLGYRNPPADARDIFFDPSSKRTDALDGVNYLGRMFQSNEGASSWLFADMYRKMKAMAAQDRIRGFSAQFPEGIEGAAAKLIPAYGIRNLVLQLPEDTGQSERFTSELGQTCQLLTRWVKKLWII